MTKFGIPTRLAKLADNDELQSTVNEQARTIAAQAEQIERLKAILKNALQTAEFEQHAFRPRHQDARAELERS